MSSTLWMVFALSLASGVVTAIDNPTRQSFYVEMVGEEHVTNAVSLNSAAFMCSRVLGPAVAGILIATVGIAICFLVDGAVLPRGAHRAAPDAPGRVAPPDADAPANAGTCVAGLRYIWGPTSCDGR